MILKNKICWVQQMQYISGSYVLKCLKRSLYNLLRKFLWPVEGKMWKVRSNMYNILYFILLLFVYFKESA